MGNPRSPENTRKNDVITVSGMCVLIDFHGVCGSSFRSINKIVVENLLVEMDNLLSFSPSVLWF